MSKFLRPVAAILLFLLMQVLGSLIAMVMVAIGNSQYLAVLMSGEQSEEVHAKYLTTDVLAWALVISGVLTAIFLACFKLIDVKKTCSTVGLNWKWAGVAILGAMCGIFSTNLITEWLELPNLMEEQFIGMSNNVVGILAIAVLGPIVEELTFREAIIGNLLKKNVAPWTAILFSALCFGLIHANPAQIPFACIVGVILGIIYVKTGNVVVTSIIHIINNSIAVLQMNMLGDEAKELSFRDVLGVMDIPAIIILGILSAYIMTKYWKGNVSAWDK